MDAEFQFLINYRLLAKKGASLFWFMPIDYYSYEDLAEVIKSYPSHSLIVVTYYDSVESLLELVQPHVRHLSWIKLNLDWKDFRYKAGLMSNTHFTPSYIEMGIKPWDEGAFEYFDWLEEQTLSESTEIINWSNAA